MRSEHDRTTKQWSKKQGMKGGGDDRKSGAESRNLNVQPKMSVNLVQNEIDVKY